MMLRRPANASAAWHAIAERLPRVLAALRAEDVDDLIAATGALCNAQDRASVATALAPIATASMQRRIGFDRALATIDRCIAQRAAAGDISRALALTASTASGGH